MNEREYNRLKQQIENDYKKKLEALDIIWQMAKENVRETPVNGKSSTVKAGTLMGAIRQVLPFVSGEFDINTIIQLVEARRPDIKTPINPTSVSGSLRKLEKANAIVLMEAGAGKRPNRYRKAGPSAVVYQDSSYNEPQAIDEADIPF
jgi:hypothetical protein